MNIAAGLAAALVFSHLAAIPALIYLVWRGLIVETTVLATAVVVSTLYHLCQVGWVCFGLDLHALQVSDHFMVFFALVWFLLYAAGSTERIRAAVTIAVMGISLPFIISNLDSWVGGAVVTGVAIVAFIATFIAYASVRKAIQVEWRAFAVSLFLILAGVVLHVYGGDYGPLNTIYPVAHSVWHVLAFLSLYYIVMIPFTSTSILTENAWQKKHQLKRRVRQLPREDYPSNAVRTAGTFLKLDPAWP